MKVVKITMKSLYFLVAFSLLIVSCEKEDDISIPKGTRIPIEGEAILGDTLTLILPKDINFGKVSFQWRRYSEARLTNNYNYYDIEGANQSKYVVTKDDITGYLLVEVTTSVQDEKVYSDFTKQVYPLRGAGTSYNPYKIYYIEDLALIGAHHLIYNYYEMGADFYFSLERDLDFSVDSCYRNPADNSHDWDDNDETTKGIKETFTTGGGFVPLLVNGNFNGNNHTIAGLYINRQDYASLFDEIRSIKNLKLKNIDITGGYAVGGLAGSPSELNTIENCYVSGKIKVNKQNYGGGLVGEIDLFNVNSVTLRNNEVDVNLNDSLTSMSKYVELGGLVGNIRMKDNNSIVIENNVTKGRISSKTYKAGGIIGRLSTSNASSFLIRNNYSSASVEGGYVISGFIGEASMWGGTITISDNYCTGAVKSVGVSTDCKLSGFIGIVDFVEYGIVNIKNNYTTSNIVGNGTSSAAGIVGHLEASASSYSFNIANCIAFTSSITGANKSNRILGSTELYNYATVRVNYYNNYANSAMTINGSPIVDSGIAPENGINGKSLAETNFGNLSFYTNPVNWNTINGTMWDFINIWDMRGEKGRPTLRKIVENP